MYISKPDYTHEGHVLDDYGNLIVTKYVDFREPACRESITTLIKGSETRYSIDVLGTIRVSKPECFRSEGETLIADPEEARATRKTLDFVRIDDPSDLKEARERNEEGNRAAELVGASIKSTTTSIKRTSSKTETITRGKNWWIYCTSIEPTSQDEKIELVKVLDPKYDCFTKVYRPRSFAHALGSMVAEQLGPLGPVQTYKSRFGELCNTTHHKSQMIVHGPVVYVENTYSVVTSGRTELEALFLPMFIKRMKYQNQREYRFVIYSENELKEKCKDLDVSLAMHGSMKKVPKSARRGLVQNLGVSAKAADLQEGKRGHAYNHATDIEPNGTDTRRELPDIMDLVTDPATPVAPSLPAGPDYINSICEVTDEVLRTLRNAIEKIPDTRLIKASSSAFHSEPLLRRLCEEFENPVRTISISEDDFIVIVLNTPNVDGSKAQIAIGPHGEGAQYIKGERTETGGFLNSLKNKHEFPLGTGIIEELTKLGVQVRKQKI